jgi:chemotaxis protein methyltransferase CheR
VGTSGQPDSTVSLSDAEFALFQVFIHREIGILLADAKKALVVARLSGRLRATGLSSFGKYYRHAMADPAERLRLIDCITTNETHFFREPQHFEVLAKRLLPEWQAMAAAGQRSRRIRVWSAGCSTGEEPYSLAMTLLYHFHREVDWSIDITATDISTRVLERAAEGIWSIDVAEKIPLLYLKAFMLRGTGIQEGKMKAGSEIRRVVRFTRLNLNDEHYALPGRFDLIFCRNVLIYFRGETKRRILDRLIGHLAPGGCLFLGHAESLIHRTDHLEILIPTVYRLAPNAGVGVKRKTHGAR